MKTFKIAAAGSILSLIAAAALAVSAGSAMAGSYGAYGGGYGAYGGGYGAAQYDGDKSEREARRQWINGDKVYWCDFSTGVRRDCEFSHIASDRLGKKDAFDFN